MCPHLRVINSFLAAEKLNFAHLLVLLTTNDIPLTHVKRQMLELHETSIRISIGPVTAYRSSAMGLVAENTPNSAKHGPTEPFIPWSTSRVPLSDELP